MTLSALGIFSAAGAGGVAGTYELIETQILGSDQASITFSSLSTYSATYKHLQIRLAARTTRSGFSGGNVAIRFNADTGTNYAQHGLFGTTSSRGSFGSSSANFGLAGWVAAATATSNQFGASVVDILDPYATKNKTVRSLSGNSGGADTQVRLMSSAWLDTTSVTSITILGDGGNLVSGSRFSIYGLRG
jgi:hypothetical protein